MSDDWFDEMRSEVLGARRRLVATRERRRRSARMVAIAAAVVLVAATAGVFMSREQAAAGVDVARDGSDLVVRLTDLESDPSEVEQAAADAGLDVQVDEVPVGSAMVGRFVSADGDTLPGEVRTVDEHGVGTFDGFRVPAGFTGTIRLHLGRAAKAGESWVVRSDATAPGEPLACTDLSALDVAGAVDLIERHGGGDVRVFILDRGGEVPVDDLGAAARAVPTHVMRTSPTAYTVEAWADPASNPNPPRPSKGC